MKTVEERRVYTHEYYLKNKIRIKEQCREYRCKNDREYYRINRQKAIDYGTQYYKKHKDKIDERKKQYNILNRAKISKCFREWRRKKYYSDPCFKLVTTQRSRIRVCIKRVLATKEIKSLRLLGCTAEQLKAHLESLWTEGMNWGNYGKYGWHVDHIKPLASFYLTSREQQKIAFNYINLQPLWAKDNLLKGNKVFKDLT